MVKLYVSEPANQSYAEPLLNIKSNPSLIIEKKSNNNNPEKHNENHHDNFNYTKILIENPYNNRDIVIKITKGQKGVYI